MLNDQFDHGRVADLGLHPSEDALLHDMVWGTHSDLHSPWERGV